MSQEDTTVPEFDIGADDFAATRPPDDEFDIDPVVAPKIPTGPKALLHGNRGRGGRGRNGTPRGNRGRGRGVRGAFVGGNSSADGGSTPETNASGLGSSRYASPAPNIESAGVKSLSEAAPASGSIKEEPVDTAESQARVDEALNDVKEERVVKDQETEEGEPSAAITSTSEAGTEGQGNTDATASKQDVEKKAEYPKRDRIMTGGLKKPKLSETELTERMNAMKLKNQNRTERLLRAAEDEERFKEDEERHKATESERKAQEAVNRLQARKKKAEGEKRRKEMDAEREKNRQRKLNAVSNREWDNTKTEEDYNPAGYNPRYRRTAQGGVQGTISNPSDSYARQSDNVNDENAPFDQDFNDDREGWGRGRGRGGGGRGGRGGNRGRGGGGRGSRGDGEGGQSNYNTNRETTPANIHSETEFPSLGGTKDTSMKSIQDEPQQKSHQEGAQVDSTAEGLTSALEKAGWAEQEGGSEWAAEETKDATASG